MSTTPVDNVTFFLNCNDARERRCVHRAEETARRHHARAGGGADARSSSAGPQEQQAAADAQTAPTTHRTVEQEDQEIEQRPDIDAQAKQIMARNIQQAESRRLGLPRRPSGRRTRRFRRAARRWRRTSRGDSHDRPPCYCPVRAGGRHYHLRPSSSAGSRGPVHRACRINSGSFQRQRTGKTAAFVARRWR